MGQYCGWETLQNQQWPVHELLITDSMDQPELTNYLDIAETRQIPIHRVPASRLEQLCKAKDHQGVLAKMGPFPYAEFDQLHSQLGPHSRWLIVDRIQDPYNLGAIIRSAAAFRFEAILMASSFQVGVTIQVTRSSAGAVNRLPICRMDSLSEGLKQLQNSGMKLLAADMRGAEKLDHVVRTIRKSPQAVGLIMGNEATGVSPELLQLSDTTVSIPMSGDVESLNAAVAAGILMYSLRPEATS